MSMFRGLFGVMSTLAVAQPGALDGSPIGAADVAIVARCCSVVELRRYTLHPFKRDVLIDLFEHEFVEAQEVHGIRLIGTFRDLDAPDRFVWLRGFADMAARTHALSAFYDGAVWRTHRAAANRTMVDSHDVLLLRPVWVSAAFDAAQTMLPPRDATTIPPDVVVVHVHHLQAGQLADSVGAFTRDAIPMLGDAKIDVIAVLASESAPNGFPRLPVREGEHVLAWVARYPDVGAHVRSERVLSSHPAWRRIESGLRDGAVAPAQMLRLQPTARSRLPGER